MKMVIYSCNYQSIPMLYNTSMHHPISSTTTSTTTTTTTTIKQPVSACVSVCVSILLQIAYAITILNIMSLPYLCCCQTESVFQIIQVPIPSNVYQINLLANDALTVQCKWYSSLDIDLKLFQGGPNLVTLLTANSVTPAYQSLTYTATIDGNFYVKVYCYSTCAYEEFQLVVKVNGITKYSMYDTTDVDQNKAVKHIVFENACRTKIAFVPSSLSATIDNFTSISTFAAPTTTFFTLNILNAGKLKLQINAINSLATALTSVIVNITTFSDSKCLTFCQTKPYTSGKGIMGSTICNCLPKYVWNDMLKRCQFDCLKVVYSTGNNGVNACNCVSKFVWDSINMICVVDCDPSSSIITNVASSTDKYTCQCISGYMWIQSTLQCALSIDCSLHPYQTGQLSVSSCSCATGFNFDPATYRCTKDCSSSVMSATTGLLLYNTYDICICLPTFYYDTDVRLCMACPVLCKQCIQYNTTDQSCTQCANNTLQLYTRALPYICRQICGDGVTLGTPPLPCDNALNLEYDGCNNYCQVQDGFVCNISTDGTGKTICSYTRQIQMQLVQFNRMGGSDIGGINNINIKVRIWPPLHVFSIMTQPQLKQIFKISIQDIKVNSIKYTQYNIDNNGYLQIQSQLLSDLLPQAYPPQHIYIQFDPSLSTSTVLLTQHYYQTPSHHLILKSQAQTMFALPLYYYSNIAIFTYKLLPILSYGLLVLGWLSVVLGMAMRRLAGLQAMWVLQMSYMPILWLNGYLMRVYQGMAVLVYTGAYNIQIINEDSAIGTTGGTSSPLSTTPHVQIFPLSQYYFLNNYNLAFLFIVVPAIAYMLSSIRLRKYLLQHSHLNLNTLDSLIKQQQQYNSPLCQQLSRLLQLQQQYQHTLQYLLYGTMLNIFYFLSMLTLFIRSSTHTHVPSIIMICIVGVGIVLVVFKFYRDPCPFGYFRTSFRTNLIAVNHYYIHIIVLSTIVCMLSLIDQYGAYIAVALSIKMCVFTLVFKPYRNTKQNYRSSYNYFTTAALIGIKIYMQIVPTSIYNSTYTYIYILVVFAGLLPIAVIISIISNIYYWVYYKYIKPKQDQELKKNQQFAYDKKKRKFMNQLNIINVRDRLSKIKQQTVYKSLIPSKINMVDYSNYIKDQQLLKQYQKNIRSLSLKQSRPIMVDNKEQNRHDKQQQIREQLRIFKKQRKQKKIGKLRQQKIQRRQDDGKFSSGEQLQKYQQKQYIIKDGEIIDIQEQDQEISSNYSTRKIAEEILNEQNKFINYKGSVEYTKKQMGKYKDQMKDVYIQAYDQIYGI